MVGDRERIDTELAEALITRLHSAGLELHRGLALPLGGEARDHIELVQSLSVVSTEQSRRPQRIAESAQGALHPPQ